MTVSPGSQAEAAEPPRPSLDALLALTAHDMRAVNEIIVARMASPVDLIPRLAGYLVASGGKRLRPMLTVASARLCGHRGQQHVALAAAVEFIHTATLLHDDVVDESDLRRGQASANEIFGNKPSVLVGDFLFARAFQLMVVDGSLKVLDILANASAVISEGEVLQLAASNDTETTRETYLEVIRCKTAELFAAACQVGAVVAEASPAIETAMRDFGSNLGIAFQLIDDVLDYSALQARLGKTVGDDFREGKITLPVVLAIDRADATERAFWKRTLEDVDQREGDLEHAQDLLRKHGALDATVAEARRYADAARAALAGLPDGPLLRAFDETVGFCVERDY